MRFGLPTSLLLHGGLLAWALIGFQEIKPFKPSEPEPVEVAMITEDGLTRLMQGDRNAKNLQAAAAAPTPPSNVVKETPRAKPPEPTPPPKPAEPAAAEPPAEPVKPPPPQKAAEPPPKTVPPPPQKDEIAELALKAEADAKLEAEAKAAAEAKARADAAARAKAAADAKARADLKAKADKAKADKAKADKAKADKAIADASKKDSLEDLADMVKPALADKDKKRAPQLAGSQIPNAVGVKGAQAGAPEGRDTKLTGSEKNLIISRMRQQLKRCWNLPAGADGADAIVTEVDFRLSPAGELIGAPKVVSRISTPLQQAMADIAVRAVIQCNPYSGFPPDLYKGGWDYFIWEFNPREMLR